jgi:cytochrome P450
MSTNKQLLVTAVRPPKRTPPPTSRLPVVGSIPQFLQQQHHYFVEARATYGDIYTMSLGPLTFIALNRPEQAQHVLIDNARNYNKDSAFWNSLRTLLGNGLPLSEGDFWRRQRRMMQPQFHRQRLMGLTTLMVEAIDEGIADLAARVATAQPLNIAQAMSHLTMKVIVRTMFGTDLDPAEAETVRRQLTYALDFIVPGMITQSLPGWVPVPGRRRYQSAVRTIDAVVFQIIERRRQQGEGNDLISLLLHMVDAETGEQMTAQQLRDEAVTMFLAGYETTATTLAWIWHAITQQPAIEHKLQAEVDTALGDRTPVFADLPNLPYARMVMQEALRLYPPAYWLPRKALADDEIDGYHIPAGSAVAPVMYTIQRHPDIWEAPEVFNPERFASTQSAEAPKARHKLAWMPFGAGQRLCIGQDFALLEGQLILARMMQRYHVSAVPGRLAQPTISTTLRTKDGVWVRVEPRH